MAQLLMELDDGWWVVVVRAASVELEADVIVRELLIKVSDLDSGMESVEAFVKFSLKRCDLALDLDGAFDGVVEHD